MSKLVQPVVAGAVTAVVGFASSFAIVLAGLRAVGASPAQASSGLLAGCLAVGAVAVLLGVRHRLPIAIAWSTPGAALLVATGVPEGGWPAATGAFLVTGLLIVLAGLFAPLGRWIAAIPQPVAGAMLAGVLLDLCLAPVRAVAEVPALAVPVIVVWALLFRFARLWAVPVALVVAAAGIALTAPAGGLGAVSLWPTVALTAPAFTPAALISLAVPLFLVTMASQNVPGMAVLAGFGYRAPLRPVLLTTGVATVVAAPAGAHAVNLAAISAALAAGPDASPDPGRRWIASVSAGGFMILLGLGAGLATALVLLSPPVLIEAVAGLALLSALASALSSAVAEPSGREAAVVTFVVTASGVSFLGIGSAFWGLIAGTLLLLLLRTHRRSAPAPSGPASTAPATARPADAEPATAHPATAEPAVDRPAGVQPAAVRPAVIEPAAAQSANAEPDADRPAGMEPAAAQPANPEPAVDRPAGMEPAAAQPANPEPAADRPANGEPAAHRPIDGEPTANRLADVRPAAGRPAGGEPGTVRPDGGDEAAGEETVVRDSAKAAPAGREADVIGQ
ncbi:MULTISPECIES: benzoate/H(+) symporter BenE family transporter [Catenuloplanes]|uniref:Benzoate membrane transport protein n=1 Tax=Catenuloplanes niger TaxID=587534 RepID=A0AAE4CUH6_9ACTN|nr:benzoate/H(+) symporter BenE family transporter [Catenuloplanes niger]MDR7325150.1 benzoate membrane transport protein [Catenuloplanes niger]